VGGADVRDALAAALTVALIAGLGALGRAAFPDEPFYVWPFGGAFAVLAACAVVIGYAALVTAVLWLIALIWSGFRDLIDAVRGEEAP
jgi:hypothetical protein